MIGGLSRYSFLILARGDGYMTAWPLWQLAGDGEAARAFVGKDAEIARNPGRRGVEMQHCFVASERDDEVARDAFERTLAFLGEQVAPSAGADASANMAG